MKQEITFVAYKKRPCKKKSRKPRTKSRQALERDLWKVFSLYIRKRDGRCMMGTSFQGYLCSGPLQAGHIISRRKLPTKYDEMNVWGQCARHNWIHNRTPETYINWFIKTHGAEEFAALVTRSERPGKALNTKELQEKTEYYLHLLTS